MAKFEIDGLDELQRALQGLDDGLDEFIDDILNEGGRIAKQEIEQSIVRHGHFATGELLRSIKIDKVKEKDGVKYLDVAPKGSHTSRYRNGGASKKYAGNWYVGFVLNYGTSKIRGSRFWSEAEEKAKERYQKELETRANQYMKEKGLGT